MTGFDKLANHSADTRTLRIVAGLKELVENAIPIYGEAHKPKPSDIGKRTNVVAWHTYAVKSQLDGESVYVKLVVRESAAGKFFIEHFHDATVTPENEMQEDSSSNALPVSNRGQARTNLPDKD